jgi:hypothetical protein
MFLCPAPVLSAGPQVPRRDDSNNQCDAAKQDNDAGHGSPLLTSAIAQPVKNIQIARRTLAPMRKKGASSKN